LRDLLDVVSKRHPDLIIKFGGHAMAAGLSILEHNIVPFQTAFETVLAEYVPMEDLTQTWVTDGSLTTQEISLAQAKSLAEPIWGQGFAEPRFQDVFQVAWQKQVGVNHKKVGLYRDGQIFEAMIFRCTEDLPAQIHAVYRPVVNEWRQNIELQLYIDFWQAA
jgi:single-stranded-DNA-specific exonuclease